MHAHSGVSVRLHVVESYFAIFSTRRATIRQVDHLQNALKLRRTEIDALFLGTEETEPGKFEEFIITCEAKRVGEGVISEQVLQQVMGRSPDTCMTLRRQHWWPEADFPRDSTKIPSNLSP